MTFAVSFDDSNTRKQVPFSAPYSNGSASPCITPSAFSLATNPHSNGWERRLTDGNEHQSFHDAADESRYQQDISWHPSNPQCFGAPSFYGSVQSSALDASSHSLDSVSLPEFSMDFDFPLDLQHCQVPSMLPSNTSVPDSRMYWHDFSPELQVSDASENPFSSSMPSAPCYAISSSYPSTPTSSTSYSPHLQEERNTSTSNIAQRPPQPPTGAAESTKHRPHPCLYPDCGRWFTRSYTRNVHSLTHNRSNDPKPFACTIADCAEAFSRKHDRLRHEVRQHGRGSDWPCPLCATSKFYSSQATLERHLNDKHHRSG